MNIEKINKLFTLFSGEEYEEEKHQPFIDLAVSEVMGMLREGADENDTRLDFLVAADANYRCCQALLSADGMRYTYGGSMPDISGGKKNCILDFSMALLKDNFQMCSDLINGGSFVFFSFSNAEVQRE